jgi:hypothetical protein
VTILGARRKAIFSSSLHRLSGFRQQMVDGSHRLDWLWQPFLAFSASRALIFLVAIVGDAFLETEPGHWVADPNSPFFSLWAKWDSQWYVQIARDGYWFQPLQQSNVAFFPLYPLLTRLTAPLLDGNLVRAGFVVSNLAFFLALIVLYRLTSLLLSEQTTLDRPALRAASQRTIFYMAFFPTAFFYSAVYTESLFLLLSVATVYFARQQRWFPAAAAGLLAATTRNLGVLLWALVLWEWLRFHGWNLEEIHHRATWRSLWIGMKSHWYELVVISVIPVGLLLYMAFLEMNFARPLAFVEVQAAWGRQNIGPVAVVIREMEALAAFTITKGNLSRLLNLSTFLTSLALVPFIWRRFGAGYALYTLVFLLLPAASGLQSMIRYVLPLFPIFILLGYWGRHSSVDRVLLATFSVLLGLMTTIFANWVFVA